MTDLSPIILLLVAALATARVTSLIVFDSILEPVRHRIWLLSPPTDDPTDKNGWYVTYDRKLNSLTLPRHPGFFGQLISCHHCVGVWVAALVWPALVYWPDATVLALAPFALAQSSDITIKAAR